MDILSEQNSGILKSILLDNTEDNYECGIVEQCFDVLGLFIIAVDKNWKITFANRRAKEVLNYKDNGLSGKNFINDLVTKDEQKVVESTVNILYNNESNTLKFLCSLKTSSNKQRTIDAQAIRISDVNDDFLGFVLAGKDVSSYTGHQLHLQKYLNMYKLLLNNIPELSVFVFDKDLRFSMAEGMHIRNIGLQEEELEGKTLYEISGRKIKDRWIPLFLDVFNGKDVKKEYKLDNKHYLIRITPLRNEDNIIDSGLAVIRDISGDKISKKILKKAKDEAVKSMKTKSLFLARVSHEIRTPLNAIMGFTEQLLQTKLNGKQKEFLGIIDKSSELLLSLVNDILVLSKIEANQLNFESSPFKVGNVLNYVHNALIVKAREKNLRFTYKIDDKADRVLLGDSFRLQQILINLAGNAIKFTNNGSVVIKCSMQDESDEQITLNFDVTDTGIGISPKYLKDIFNQYTQSVTGSGKQFEGVGLGLAICKNLIELQDGTLTVTSQQGSGTTFTFSLPYAKAEEIDAETFDPDTIDPGKLKDKRVLLVDDDNINLLLGKTILEKFSCPFDIANNGKEAIEKIDKGRYDIILLDIHMPDINGIEVAKYLRKQMKDTRTKIIALTAAAMKDDIIKYRIAGIDDFIIKPFREIYLYNKICEVLQLTKKSQPVAKTEIILKKEFNPRPYNLFELKKIAGDDEDFVKHTLQIFIENSEEAVINLRKFLKEEKWKQAGETAHKILPSFRHLEVNTVVSKLVEIKTRTLVYGDNMEIANLINDVVSEIENVLADMREELR